MSRITLAMKCFFGILFGSIEQRRAERVLIEPAETDLEPTSPPARPVPAPLPRSQKTQRSEAITLLAALQREARFVDLVQEPLQQYTDQQIGAAARDVLRDCHAVLSRMFAIQPVLEAAEGAAVETPEKIPAGRMMVTGKPSGEPPFRGRLVHHGWEASQCQLPEWSGDEQAKNVIAPAEIECP